MKFCQAVGFHLILPLPPLPGSNPLNSTYPIMDLRSRRCHVLDAGPCSLHSRLNLGSPVSIYRASEMTHSNPPMLPSGREIGLLSLRVQK